jgi:hypothetical protein
MASIFPFHSQVPGIKIYCTPLCGNMLARNRKGGGQVGSRTRWSKERWKQGSWLIKMDSNDRVISIYRPRH